jgi:ABC-type dipeptide/oligopeptide/nickel transport system permease component
MNPFEFVLALLVLMFVFTIIRHKMGIPVRSMRQMRGEPEDSQETLRLREEVKALKERLQVLERITVEKENSLAKEIDELRDQ